MKNLGVAIGIGLGLAALFIGGLFFLNSRKKEENNSSTGLDPGDVAGGLDRPDHPEHSGGRTPAITRNNQPNPSRIAEETETGRTIANIPVSGSVITSCSGIYCSGEDVPDYQALETEVNIIFDGHYIIDRRGPSRPRGPIRAPKDKTPVITNCPPGYYLAVNMMGQTVCVQGVNPCPTGTPPTINVLGQISCG